MGKFVSLEQDVFSVFASPEWVAEDIKTFPTNYIAVSSGKEFIRVSVIPSGNGLNRNSTKGILIIDIFIPAGEGTRRAFEIADALDSHLVNKSIKHLTDTAQTQFGFSSISPNGVDKDTPSLYRVTYSITFNYFCKE
jgi:hypothetical protein